MNICKACISKDFCNGNVSKGMFHDISFRHSDCRNYLIVCLFFFCFFVFFCFQSVLSGLVRISCY